MDVLPLQPRHRDAPLLGQQRPLLSGQIPARPLPQTVEVECCVVSVCLYGRDVLLTLTSTLGTPQGVWIPRARESPFSRCQNVPIFASSATLEISCEKFRPLGGLRILRWWSWGQAAMWREGEPGAFKSRGAA